MNDLLLEYLSDLGAPDALRLRVGELVRSYEAVLDEDIDAWFVSEYVEELDQRTFESLWLFSENFAMEAQLLGSDEDHFDFVPFRTHIRHVVVSKRAFNLAEPTAASRMSVETWFEDRRYGVMRASGDNCAPLVDILKSVLLPNAR